MRATRHFPAVLRCAVLPAVAALLVAGCGPAATRHHAGTATNPGRSAATIRKAKDPLGSADAASVSRSTQVERTAATLAGVAIERDLTFTSTTDPAPLALDVYRATPKAGVPVLAKPVVLVIHGGGWRTGDKDDVAVEALRLARNGFVAVAPNYRLACGSSHEVNPVCGWHHPAPVQDVGEALRWVRAKIAPYGGDPTRIGLLGFSAGGQLAEMAAYGADPGAPRVGAVVAWSAPLPRLLGTSRRRLTDYRYVGCSFRRCPQKWLAASPDTYVSSDDPPTRIVQSSHEIVPNLHGRELARVLRAAGVPVQYQVYVGTQHATQYELREWSATLRFLTVRLAHAPVLANSGSHVVPKVFGTAGD